MSIEHSQILACFCTILSYSFYGRSGPGPLAPVRKILVVRSGPEGPHFARSVGTLLWILKEFSYRRAFPRKITGESF